MKRSIIAFAVLFSILSVSFTGCKKDEKPAADIQKLCVVKRSSGELFTVNTTSGALTSVGNLMFDSSPLTGMRGMIYDNATGKCYLGATNDGGAGFYSLDLSNLTATLLNDNTDETRDAVADMIIAPDGNVLAVIWSNTLGNSALAEYNKSTGAEGTHSIIWDGTDVDGLWSPGGIVYGATNSSLILGGDSCVFSASLTGLVNGVTWLKPPAAITGSDLYVMDLTKDKDGVVYSLLYDYDNSKQYLITLNTTTGVIQVISNIASGSNQDLYHCLAFIPESKL
jgi:hypothetical protein